MYVSEICAEGIFVTFPWWLKNVKSRSKIALFSNEHHFEIWFPKKKTITFFWSKFSKLHKKDQFCMWQLHLPIQHPLKSESLSFQWAMGEGHSSLQYVNMHDHRYTKRCFAMFYFVLFCYLWEWMQSARIANIVFQEKGLFFPFSIQIQSWLGVIFGQKS